MKIKEYKFYFNCYNNFMEGPMSKENNSNNQTTSHKIPEQELSNLAEFFKVFGDPTRIQILWTLFENELCVNEISELLDMSQSAISHQLRILKNAKLVKNRREGRSVVYSLDDKHIYTIFNQGLQHILEQE